MPDTAVRVVSLREVTADNRAAVEALAVTEEQSHYVASVTTSMQEADEYPDARLWYRAVYADDEPVGFIMIADGITVDDATYVGPSYLWRLLVDRQLQGRGYGTAPVTFYLQYGFRLTGEVHEGEPLLEYELARP